MEYIKYAEIENFKGFGEKIHVPISNPSVLIGPNNAGKTTVIQALSLWSRAVGAWYEKKGGGGHKKSERYGVGINRLNIMDIPVKESRYYWNGTRVRSGKDNIYFSIEVGVVVHDAVKPLKMLFNFRDQESLYARPDDATVDDAELFETARKLQFNLLYPMSGIASGASQSSEEFLMDDGHMNVLIGQGQTALVLRNLCYKVYSSSPDDWQRICEIVDRMFGFEMGIPAYDSVRGALTVEYRQRGVDNPLEIALSGRGVQQMLLILAYLYGRKGGILMIDEPDAHLEILRQRQVFAILKEASEETSCQILIATHSEVILDEAIETNLTFLVNGTVSDLASNKDIKQMLRSIGVEHYYNARVAKRLLIVEGSTDVEMLKAFAKVLKHPAEQILSGRLFTYYVRDTVPEASLDKTLERMGSPGVHYQQYYNTLKHLVPELRGLALFDSDLREPVDEMIGDDMAVRYWKRYELENYFITPERLVEYMARITMPGVDLFEAAIRESARKAVDESLAKLLFGGDVSKVGDYYGASDEVKQILLQKKKMSAFAEDAFARFHSFQNLTLSKGGFYRIIEIMKPTEVPDEVVEKLDDVVTYLGHDDK